MKGPVTRAGSALLLSWCLLANAKDATPRIPPLQPLADWPQIVSPIRTDAATERRITRIVAGMTLEQKIGQMTQADIRSITPAQVREFFIGSVLNGGGAWPSMNKHARLSEWTDLAHAYHQASMSTGIATPIPIVWGTDAVHGHNNVFGATLFPHNIGLGAARDPELVREIGRTTAAAVRATGANWAFAPTVAVAQNPRWGRTYESYSADPAVVRSYGAALVRGLQWDLRGNRGVIASAKHFIGDGGTFQGIDQGVFQGPMHTLLNVHAQGYFGALEAGVQSVMISYSSWHDTVTGVDHGKMHGNRALITGILKERLGFDGLVVSDWNAIEQVPGCSRTHCPAAINAGVDLVMVPDDWRGFIVETVADVNAGRIAMTRIDDAVARIIRVKMRAGLFDRPVSIGGLAGRSGVIDSSASKALARRAVRESLVLLKNDSGVLPLARHSRLLVVGVGATDKSRQTGGWSMTWQGTDNVAADFPQGDDLLSAVRKTVTSASVEYSATGRDVDVRNFDAVLVVASEAPYAEMKGDIRHPQSLRHSERYPADLEALQAVARRGVPVITVLFSGRPLYTNDLLNESDAFVVAWLPGTEALGITDVLFRDKHGRVNADFRGRLPFEWVGSPCPERDASAPLFPLGYGLDYGDQRALPTLPVASAPSGCEAPAG